MNEDVDDEKTVFTCHCSPSDKTGCRVGLVFSTPAFSDTYYGKYDSSSGEYVLKVDENGEIVQGTKDSSGTGDQVSSGTRTEAHDYSYGRYSDNTDRLEKGRVTILGGNHGFIHGAAGFSSTGSVTITNNTVEISDGTIEFSSVYGGQGGIFGNDNDSVTVITDNTVKILGGTIDHGEVFGGDVYITQVLPLSLITLSKFQAER